MTGRVIKWRALRHHWELYLFVIPTLVLIGMFVYYPAASGVFHSFFRWNAADISEYVGLGNYVDLLTSTEFWASFKVALLLGAFNILKMIPALVVAVCIHRCTSRRLQFLYRTMFVIPMVIPGLVTVLIWRSFFFEASQGYLNQFLELSGLMNMLVWLDANLFHWGVFLPGVKPAWLGDPKLILTACIVWGFPWVGSFAVLTHLAKLGGISKDVYEAASIDGVNWWTKFTRIELPLISGSIYLLLVFVIIETIKDAGMILALAGMEGGPGGKATVPALFMIRKAFVEQQMGYACAVGIILTVIVMSLQKIATLVINWSELSQRQKMGLRLGVLLGAGALLVSQRFVPLAWLMAVIAVPYGWVRDQGVRLLMPRHSALVPGARSRVEVPVSESPRWHRWGGQLLRLNKHLTIWAVLLFAFLPVYLLVVVSFKTNQQFYAAPATLTTPLHPENWQAAWETITPSVANSLFIATLSTAGTLFLALCAAYFFARQQMPMARFLWNAILVLMMMPLIANLVPLFRLLSDLNLLNTLAALIIVACAAGQIFAIFVLRNFIADIPQDLFEAAEIDGANHFRQMWMVVLPLSGPILGTVGVMHFLTAWNEFVLPLIVMRDHNRLPVMVQLLRMNGEYIKLWGPLMAGYAFASIPVILLFIFSMKLFVRGLTEGAVKG